MFLCFLSLQPASLSKVKWALRAYTRWINYRMEIHHARNTASFTRENRPIKLLDSVAHDIDELKTDMCDFIVEIRKENGEQYPGSSLYDLLSGLSLYLQREKGFDEKLMSEVFKDIRNTLDNIMKERAMEGVGINRPEREFVSHEHEEILWQKNILGDSNPDQLRRTVFFMVGSRFGLRGRKEHHDLRRYPDSQINMIKVNGKDALIYKEFSSKTRQGGIKDRHLKAPEVRYAFCSGCKERCFVELYRKYMRLGPKGNKSWPKFYVQTDPKWHPGAFQWYTNRPVGKNTIGEYLQKMMAEAGIEGHFRNHSLRKATATRLFEKGVDPQLIKEQTGHKSDAVMLYKKSNIKMKEQVSHMLNVLPSQMQSLRDRERVMLQDEEKSERNKMSAYQTTNSKVVSSQDRSTSPSKEIVEEKAKSEDKGDVLNRDHNCAKMSDQKHVVLKSEDKPQINVDPSKGLDVHVPVSTMSNLASLQGLVNIHFHIYNGAK